MDVSWISIAYALAAALATALLWLGINPLMRWKLRHLPGPFAWPFIGNLPSIVRYGIHEYTVKVAHNYGPVALIWFGGDPTVVVSDPEMARKVLLRFNQRRRFPGVLRGEDYEVDRSGLVWAKDLHWRVARRAWDPAVLYPASLRGYLPCMQDSARRLCALLASGGGQEVDIWAELSRMTLDVVGGAAFGVDLKTLPPLDKAQQEHATNGGTATPAQHLAPAGSETSSPSLPIPASTTASLAAADGVALQQACRDIFKQGNIKQASAWQPLLMALPALEPLITRLAYALPDAKLAANLTSRRVVAHSGQQLVQAWKEAHASDSVVSAGNGGGMGAAGGKEGGGGPRRGPVAPGSFLGLVLAARDKESGQTLSDMEVVAQAFTFLLAGMETTANSLAFAIHLLATHPEAEARLVAEVDDLAAAKAGACRDGHVGLPDLAPEDLERLPFTSAVIDEAMRLYPAAGAAGRLVTEPVELGAFSLPPGCNALVAIYALHRDPSIWPQPEAFRPERWLPEGQDLAARKAHAFLPFGGGARMCVGYKFALQEARLALDQLYSSFSFRLTAGQVPLEVEHGITLGPKRGIRVTVHAR